MRQFMLLVLMSTFFVSCSSDEELQEIKIKDQYSISIPSFLSPATDLNDDASLQYMNAAREYYVLVIDENKKEFHDALTEMMLDKKYEKNLDGYTNLLLENFSLSAKVLKKSEVTKTTINRMPARLVNIDANFDGVEVYCCLSYLEGKDNYYQVFAWTLLSSEKEYAESLGAIAKSLKEI